MVGRNRVQPLTGMLLALALLAPALPALAQEAPAGTMLLDLVVNAGPTEVRPGPLTVPIIQGPNPFYEALPRLAPAMDVAPVRLEDAEDGLYVEAFDGAPLKLVGWAPGLEQRTWTPLEYAGEVLDASTILPVQLQGCTCAAPNTYGPRGHLTLPAGLSPPDASPLGVRPSLPIAPEALAAPGLDFEGDAPAQEAYQSPLESGEAVRLAPESVAPAALRNDSTTALAAVLAAGAALLLLKLAAPLYHRFKRKTALDNPARQRIYELLRAAPGASAAELSEGSKLHVTTVKYHLDVLRRVGMVGEQVVDGTRRFFSYENGDRVEFLTRALLDEPAAKAIYGQIEQHPGLPFIEVARALGMRKEHVHYHVKKLAKHGLLTDQWVGGRRLLFVAPAHAATAHGPSQMTPAPLALPAFQVATTSAPSPPALSPEVRA